MLINGVHYHVELHGADDPLILLHGFSGSGANWSAHAEALAQQHQVVTIDLLGHGQTESPADPARCRVERAAEDLSAVFDALDLPRVNLLGYSMGGRLALYTALAYPQRISRLILESASPGLRTEAERAARIEQDEALARRIERDGIAAFADYWTNLPLFSSQSPELRERLRAQRLDNNPTGLANSLRGMGTGAQPSLWERLSELSVPTLLMAGELDTRFAVINREMQALLPRASLVVVPDAGHTVHAEQPERWRAEVLRFAAL
ncbi:MAG: 2-succinyl-6-hydroxy-2,4-cyclohexadiene-1-carboxylate synthase [Anaerolineae bacterium]|nr:2-succinyl-6-hydroxy-2,4-cyclohexadiene-1-carboxylate synthase [Anaerolineae bacterium]